MPFQGVFNISHMIWSPYPIFLQVVDADMIILEYKLLSRLIDLINLYLSLIFLSSMGDF
jgi:hypothetical protein